MYDTEDKEKNEFKGKYFELLERYNKQADDLKFYKSRHSLQYVSLYAFILAMASVFADFCHDNLWYSFSQSLLRFALALIPCGLTYGIVNIILFDFAQYPQKQKIITVIILTIFIPIFITTLVNYQSIE